MSALHELPRVLCETPFKRRPNMCKFCRAADRDGGLRHCSRMVAVSEAMVDLLVRAVPIAAADAPVVVLGETGTGKEVLARAIHANSRRAARPLVAVNVAAIPSELLESELFGHSKGAFTGAVASKQGLFEVAQGGTLFLDEVGEMPLALQAKLLRALQDGEIRRLGETRALKVDVRIICATNRDLRLFVERGQFREDLYYRLKVFSLTVPPIRERRDDILPLAKSFLDRMGRKDDHPFRRPAEKALLAHGWPGNVREIENAMLHAHALAGREPIELTDLPEDVVRRSGRLIARDTTPSSLRLADVERAHVLRVLEACGGRQVDAARLLGIGRNTLWRKLRAWGIEERE